MYYISNSLDTINLRNQDYLKKDNQENCFILSIVGRIRPERGHLFLLKVLKELVKNNYAIKLIVVGDYKGFEIYYETLIKYISGNKLTKYIEFKGYSNESQRIISRSNILVVPYNTESFGRVVLEALQLKTPVVISKSGQTEKYLFHKKEAMLFEYGNVEECFDCLKSLIENPSLRDILITNGFNLYKKKYTHEQYAKKMNELYVKALNENRFCNI